jgi:hypothetical protein
VIEYVTPVAIASPCVGVCIINDETDWCEGCGRTLDEIAGWLTMTARERDRIMAALPERTRAIER